MDKQLTNNLEVVHEVLVCVHTELCRKLNGGIAVLFYETTETFVFFHIDSLILIGRILVSCLVRFGTWYEGDLFLGLV